MKKGYLRFPTKQQDQKQRKRHDEVLRCASYDSFDLERGSRPGGVFLSHLLLTLVLEVELGCIAYNFRAVVQNNNYFTAERFAIDLPITETKNNDHPIAHQRGKMHHIDALRRPCCKNHGAD